MKARTTWCSRSQSAVISTQFCSGTTTPGSVESGGRLDWIGNLRRERALGYTAPSALASVPIPPDINKIIALEWCTLIWAGDGPTMMP